MLAALEAIRRQPWASPDKVVLPGLSAARLYEKAFATGKDGAWGTAYWARTGHEAAETTVKSGETFQRKGAANCTVYTINDEVVAK
ncbi:hypothetical protein WCT94_05080 [Pectobacterium sp. 1950-15]|uniref:hypothetical protein n=1 Tax=Pectobacterium sp. 1950-15 TaxID=3128982 RepID=UPI00301A7E6E